MARQYEALYRKTLRAHGRVPSACCDPCYELRP
jgi:hypothetical protein